MRILNSIKEECPQLRGPLSRLEPTLEPLKTVLVQRVFEALEQLRMNSRRIHRLANPIVLAFMEPVYKSCAEMSGKGVFDKMKKHLKSYVLANCDNMSTATSTSMITDLNEAISSFLNAVQEAGDYYVIAFHRVIANVLDKNTASGTRTTPRDTIKIGTKELGESLREGIVTLDEAWKKGFVRQRVRKSRQDDEDNESDSSQEVS